MSAASDHPRASFDIEGCEAPAAAFEHAIAQGRLHHAWLLTGPEGVGKASFAYRAARRLLGAAPAPAYGPLGSAPEDTVSRLVAGQSHPDLLVLERASEDGKLKRNISVDDARELPTFFAKAPAMARYRIAIIDAADDLNVNAANAVLKTLEEPSGHGALLLVSHAPGRLLPTIRSRCGRLAFAPWSDDAVAAFAARRLGLEADEAARLARMSKGAPGRALSLHAAGALALEDTVAEAVRRLPGRDDRALLAIADGFRGGEGAARFALAIERMADVVHAGVRTLGQGAGAERWAQAWERLSRLPGEVEAVNLDRADAFWSVIGDLSAAARVQPLPC